MIWLKNCPSARHMFDSKLPYNYDILEITIFSTYNSITYQARARSAWARRACALRALGLLLADGTPTVGGGRLFEPSAKFFYGNSCNSGTESRKMVSKVGN